MKKLIVFLIFLLLNVSIFSWDTYATAFCHGQFSSSLPGCEVGSANPLAESDFLPICPRPIADRLRRLASEMRKLNQDGFLDGEFLIAQGSTVLVDERSPDLAQIAQASATQFMIGSVSKQFSAVALLKALYTNACGTTEEEKVTDVKRRLHVPLSYFLPEDSTIWKGAMPEWAHLVTLHHLLTHTSGLPFDIPTPELISKTESGKRLVDVPVAPRDIVALISKYPLQSVPGAKFSYSNSGYRLIAEVVRSVTHLPLSIYLKQQVLQPLGMVSTSCGEVGTIANLRTSAPACSALAPARSYDPVEGSGQLRLSESPEDLSWSEGSGSIVSSGADLVRWNDALHRSMSVFTPLMYGLFMTEKEEGYAYGIDKRRFFGETILLHDGMIGGYYTRLMYLPKHEISIVLFTNVDIDSETLRRESEELNAKLRESIPDDGKRMNAVDAVLVKRYPDPRGMVRRTDALRDFLPERDAE